MKKLIAMLLCLVLVVGLFAACSTSGSEGTKGTEGNKGTQGTNGKDETTKGGYDFPESVTDGVELGALPLVPAGKTATLNIGLPANVNTEDYDTNLMTLYYEEKTGVDLTFTLLTAGSANYVAEISTKIAANATLPDILWYTNYGKDNVSQWGNDGYLIDLTPYYEEQAYWFNIAYEKCIEDGAPEADVELYLVTCGIDPVSGERYSVPTVTPKNTSGDNCIHVGINTQWLKNLNLEYPKTVDQLYTVLKAFKEKDPNGNGIADEIPLLYGEGNYRSSISELLVNAFVFCNDSVFFNVTDGKVWVPYTTDEYRQALKYMNKLYEEELWSASCWSTDQTTLKGLLCPSDGINTLGVFGGHTTNVWDVSEANTAVLEYSPLLPFADETGKGGYAPFDPVAPAFYTHITSSAKDPVLAFRFVDYLLEEEASIVARYGADIGDYDDPDCGWSYAKEGDTTVDGARAHIWVKNDMWSKLSNTVWHGGGVRIGFGQTNGKFTSEGRTEAYMHRSNYYYHELRDKYLEIGQPDELVTVLTYNAEEQEVYNELFSIVNDTMMQWRAEFISGAKDIDNDSVWNAYTAALEAEGLSDIIDAAQSCYTRMMG